METIGYYLILGCIVLFVIGRLIFLATKFGLPLGRLPDQCVVVTEKSVRFARW
jgi:hypothetical protein